MKIKNKLIEEVLRLDGEAYASPERFLKIVIPTSIYATADKSGMFTHKSPELYALAPQMARLIRDLKAQLDMAVEALEMNQRVWEMSCDEPCDGEFICRASRETEAALAKIKSDEWVG